MRPVALLLAFSVLGACAGRQQPVITPRLGASEPRIELPGFVPALPAFRVELRGPAGKDVLRRAERIDDVVVAAPITVQRVPVDAGPVRRSLRVVAVDPAAFRSVAPGSTRDAGFVWTALLGGRAVLTPEAARALNFGTSGNVVVRRKQVAVGAFADNGIPNLGDVLISDGVGRATLGRADEIVVGTGNGADLDAIEARLRKRIDRIKSVRRLQVPATQPAEASHPTGTVDGELIGVMNFRILKSGFIEPDPSWVAANIGRGSVPILGTVTCHRMLFPQLAAALGEIEQAGLSREIDARQFGGCYVPRFIDRDPRRGLSMHAFGLAVDLNVSRNLLGTRGDMDPRIVAIFEKWGFEWGGRWSHPDPMHFELDRMINV